MQTPTGHPVTAGYGTPLATPGNGRSMVFMACPGAPVKGGGVTPLGSTTDGESSPASSYFPTPKMANQMFADSPFGFGAGRPQAIQTGALQAAVLNGPPTPQSYQVRPQLQRAGTAPVTSRPGLVRANTESLEPSPEASQTARPQFRPGLRHARTTPLATTEHLEAIPEDQPGLVRVGGVLQPGKVVTVNPTLFPSRLPPTPVTTPQSRTSGTVVYTFGPTTSPTSPGPVYNTPAPMFRPQETTGEKPVRPAVLADAQNISNTTTQGTTNVKLFIEKAEDVANTDGEKQQLTSPTYRPAGVALTFEDVENLQPQTPA